MNRRCTLSFEPESTKVTHTSAKKTIAMKVPLKNKVSVDQYYQGLAAGKFILPPDSHISDNPISPQYISLFGSEEQVSNCQKAQQFISSQSRKIVPMFGDGNYLSFSYAIYGSKDMHFD